MNRPLTPYFRAAVEALGLIDPVAIEWLMEIIEPMERSGEGSDAMTKAVRVAGEPLSKEFKLSVGLGPRMVVGDRFWAALTEKGQRDPIDAMHRTLHRSIFDKNREQKIEYAKERGLKLLVSVIDDGKTCAGALRIHGKVYTASRVPSFPLSRCRQSICRCCLFPVSDLALKIVFGK